MRNVTRSANSEAPTNIELPSLTLPGADGFPRDNALPQHRQVAFSQDETQLTKSTRHTPSILLKSILKKSLAVQSSHDFDYNDTNPSSPDSSTHPVSGSQDNSFAYVSEDSLKRPSRVARYQPVFACNNRRYVRFGKKNNIPDTTNLILDSPFHLHEIGILNESLGNDTLSSLPSSSIGSRQQGGS